MSDDDPTELVRFYDRGYTMDPTGAQLSARWRALGAVGQADHVTELCARAGIHPNSTLEIDCGDGALLSELSARGFGGRLVGFERSEAALAAAQQRQEIASAELFDGSTLAASDGEYDLGVLSHVLEHVPDPEALLAEAGRACKAVVIEVPLEQNLSAGRDAQHGHEYGHGHGHEYGQVEHTTAARRLNRTAARAIVTHAGLRVGAELEDALPLEVHRFFATTPTAQVAALAKWGLRAGMLRFLPDVARELFTVHYACLCLPYE
jgi:SAM-dependent methyltransferase